MKARLCIVFVILYLFLGKAESGQPITVNARELGSGTHGAFAAKLQIEETLPDGRIIDHTTKEAEITNSTAVMILSVVTNPQAIGYLSLGSLSDSVKAVAVDGVLPTAEKVKSGEYPICRPFSLVYREELCDVGRDFLSFVMSIEGQAVVEENGYSGVGAVSHYLSAGVSGRLSVSGSSSVAPVMEALQEEYRLLNPSVQIELQQSDSTTGISTVENHISDIGMSSRELTPSEYAEGLLSTVIAKDGIVIIVNKQNPVNNLSSDEIRRIYMGEITHWA